MNRAGGADFAHGPWYDRGMSASDPPFPAFPPGPGSWDWDIVEFDEVESTMDTARELVGSGRGPGLVVLAGRQRRGRGRRGAAWVCPPGLGILMTAALPGGLAPPGHPAVSWLGAVAAARVCRGRGVQAWTKWPNDVLVRAAGGRFRKIAGVLVEQARGAAGGTLDLVGIGLNVNQSEADFAPGCPIEPTSLRLETGGAHELRPLAAGLLGELGRAVGLMRGEGPGAIVREWDGLTMMREAALLASEGGPGFACRFEGLTEGGDPIVRLADGALRTLPAARARFHLADGSETRKDWIIR